MVPQALENSAPVRALQALMAQTAQAEVERGRAHETFLRLQSRGVELMSAQMLLQARLSGTSPVALLQRPPPPALAGVPVALDRTQCLEFAVGSIARVLGPEFAAIDGHPTRVRLPDEPLMLVDRVLSIEGAPRSLSSGRVVTEHDVLEGAWYLDGGRIPTCIAVEAGQADLFLSGYLGIDFETQGLRVYRLLDAAITFHRGLPQAGETIRYDIHIDRFFHQGETRLFRFRFEGTVDGQALLTMTDGTAGFFSQQELDGGQGIVHTKLDRRPQPGTLPQDWSWPVPLAQESYSREQLEALRAGDLAGCFGALFEGLALRAPAGLPGGRMRLIDRVSELDPQGGRFGLGRIRAEADIQPDDWFLTCHFSDDPVMPGTLMYECCLHTLRVYLMRLGWVGERAEMVWEPLPGTRGRLKCRGQVTAATRTTSYEVTIKELGYDPAPYAIADALMFADGRPIVEMTDMSLRLSGLSKQAVQRLWAQSTPRAEPRKPAIYDRDRITAFAIGRPSEAFGDPYQVFDEQRVIARLPGPPYQLIDRITAIEGEPWQMRAGVVVEAQYDVPPDAWYFEHSRGSGMPFAVLLEIGLQPCGWLAAYVGSALTSETDVSFRNLGGEAVQHAMLGPDAGTLTTVVKLTSVSSSGGMIIQHYQLAVRAQGRMVYEGTTYFGFFSHAALADQVGVVGAQRLEPGGGAGESFAFPHEAPFPGAMLRMVDQIDAWHPEGGPAGLGYIRGSKRVDPDEWFFQAHFFQDPVWPGSLGLEAFLQLLQVVAVRRWGGGARVRFQTPLPTHRPASPKHRWQYRGQVIPRNRRVEVEAHITAIDDARQIIAARGFLVVDGRIIYSIDDFALQRQEVGP